MPRHDRSVRGDYCFVRRRVLPRRRCGHFRRRRQGRFHSAVGQGSLHRAAIGRGRSAVAQYDVDAVARHRARPELFGPINYYDGQGFMVRKKLNMKSALELSGASICVQQGTTTELNLADYFRANNMKYRGRRDLRLRSTRRRRPMTPAAATPSPPTLSGLYSERLLRQETRRAHGAARGHLQGAARPAGAPWRRPVVRHRQVDALRPAQRRGARRHPEECRRDDEIGQSRTIKRLLGTRAISANSSASPATGPIASSSMSAITARASTAISARARKLKIKRGLNALWTKGGVQYAPPVR
jgi:general L-amino acid transport system substrate-binding protein